MKYLILLMLVLASWLALTKISQASSNLQTFSDSSFTNSTTNFISGQTIYVKVQTDNDGKDKSILNLRDSNYSLLQSITLTKVTSSLYQASLPAPQNENYYSLEAQIVSGSSSSTKVKTIKVGSPTEASVKVDVNYQVSGQSVKVQNNSNSLIASPADDSATGNMSRSRDLAEASDAEFATVQIDQDQEETIRLKITRFFKKALSFIWTF